MAERPFPIRNCFWMNVAVALLIGWYVHTGTPPATGFFVWLLSATIANAALWVGWTVHRSKPLRKPVGVVTRRNFLTTNLIGVCAVTTLLSGRAGWRLTAFCAALVFVGGNLTLWLRWRRQTRHDAGGAGAEPEVGRHRRRGTG